MCFPRNLTQTGLIYLRARAGVGCSSRDGGDFSGSEACCGSGIRSLGRTCSATTGAPCIVDDGERMWYRYTRVFAWPGRQEPLPPDQIRSYSHLSASRDRLLPQSEDVRACLHSLATTDLPVPGRGTRLLTQATRLPKGCRSPLSNLLTTFRWC